MDEALERLKQTVSRTGQLTFTFARHLVRRVIHDRLTVTAGYMAYVTLLSLVPLITVVLSALSLIPGFAEAGDQIRSFVLHNFVPASGDALEQYLNQFVANAGKMTAVGVAFLFVVA